MLDPIINNQMRNSIAFGGNEWQRRVQLYDHSITGSMLLPLSPSLRHMQLQFLNKSIIGLTKRTPSDMFCVYITVYKGSLLPPFYIGSTSTKKINRGYLGSVRSQQYSAIWKAETITNKHLFMTKIIKTFKTKHEALTYENYLHRKLNVVNNQLYINQAYAFGPRGPYVPWNKGKRGLQIPWNKGKRGLQSAWNKGIPNTQASIRMMANNPSKNKDSVLRGIRTKLGKRDLYFDWQCMQCGRSETKINNVNNNKKKFCNHSCHTTHRNLSKSALNKASRLTIFGDSGASGR